jgi:8-oxo-dGTP diphosphatase
MMAIMSQRWAAEYPELFTPSSFAWGGLGDHRLEIEFTLEEPPDALVANVKVIGRTSTGIVVCGTDQGWRMLPGGTREPGETIAETASRELYEEAGGVITGPLTWVGAFRVDALKTEPYRPHLPYPISYWLYVAVDVELRARPTNPADGENVTSVVTLPATDAIEYLAGFDDGPLTSILRLAVDMGHARLADPSTNGR